MNEPLPARTLNEARFYLRVTACPQCGGGPWQAEPSRTSGDRLAEIHACCTHCGHEQTFRFRYEHDLPADGPDAKIISPVQKPSELIDLAQWLSLFYALVASASSQSDRAVARHEGFQAALCLQEALMFYSGDDELPAETAFFSDETRAIFREHPEKFARQRLIDMRSKLPALPKMARRVAQDQRPPRKRWQFWKRK